MAAPTSEISVAKIPSLLASTVNLWVGYSIRESLSNANKPSLTSGQVALSNGFTQRDFNQLNDRNIFGAKREKISLIEVEDSKEAESGSWEDAQPTTLELRLIGTAVFFDSTDSLATIDGGGKVGTYTINDCPESGFRVDPLFVDIVGPVVSESLVPCNKLQNIATVRRIEEKRVYIYNDRDKRFEYLALKEESGLESRIRPAFVPPTSKSSGDKKTELGGTIREVGSGKYTIEAKDFDETMGNLAKIATQARIVPAFENGKSIGFKLFNIVPGSVFEKVGFKNGDIITQMNGYDLNSPDKALELYQMRSSMKQLNLDFKRGSSSHSTDISILGRP